jgi:HEAT repeat protein
MSKHNPFIDPEYQRYRRAYPSFPGVQSCLELLRRPNVKGGYWDVIFHDLQDHAPNVLDELIVACRDEANAPIRWMLLEILGSVNTPQTFSIFAEYLASEDETLREWAARGLAKRNTKEARRLLWQAQTKP